MVSVERLSLQESIEDAAKREAFEEIGVKIEKLEKVAALTFLFPNKPEWNLLVRVFIAETWEGEPTESEEMAPAWFALKDIPFDRMWPDDIVWLPQVLDGSKILGTFTFGEGDIILSQEVSLVETKDLQE